jgi:hypothetical protein
LIEFYRRFGGVYFLHHQGDQGNVDWIHVAQDRDRWWAVVNTVIKLWVP